MHIKIFIHAHNSQKFEIAEINNEQNLYQSIKDFISKLSSDKDFPKDFELFLENQIDNLDKTISIKEAGIKHGDHIFVGKCKKVLVTVNYAGKTFTDEVSPSTTMKKLKKLSFKYFTIDEVSGAELLLWFNKEPLDERQMVGSLTDNPTCSVSLVLASKKDINGDPSFDLFNEHLNLPEYLSGEIEGRWGVIKNENGPIWPVFIFWVTSSTNKKYNFKFDFTSYPNLAPTAMIWDLEENTPLPLEQRPNNTKRAKQVFKNWGKTCIYLPCDRLAFDQGHMSWGQQYPSLIWNSKTDSFLKYLNELYQILNP